MTGQLVLVAATTWDYVEIIESRHPGRAVFLTEARERRKAPFWTRVPEHEFLFEEGHWPAALAALQAHLAAQGRQPAGVACFDCESLALAAQAAAQLKLPFVSPGAVRHCADKALAKQTLRAAGLACPDSSLAADTDQIRSFLARQTGPVVVKPLSGTGSQGVVLCHRPGEAEETFALAQAWNIDGRGEVVVESLIQGPEYSCDFILSGGSLKIIRLAAKFKPPEAAFGTTAGYLVTGPGRSGLDEGLLALELKKACRCLGLDRTLGMADFIWAQGRPWFLEITPRPGGDCLPWVIEAASGLDMWALVLDFALGEEVTPPRPERWSGLAGLRLMADREGLLGKADTSRLKADRRVLQVQLSRPEGHRVTLPPRDYDSRLLGHLVFRPGRPENFEQDCLELSRLLDCPITSGPAGTPVN